MKIRQSLRRWVLLYGATMALAGCATTLSAASDTLLHDFDRDGVEEKLIGRMGTNEIQR